MTVDRHVPSPYEQLLHALGDSQRSRRLINEYAHYLASRAREVEEHPGAAGKVIDPLMHTIESWAAVMQCPQIANPDPQPPADKRIGVEYLPQARHPNGEWESVGSTYTDAFWGAERIRKRRKDLPHLEHRLVVRTTTITVQPVTEPEES